MSEGDASDTQAVDSGDNNESAEESPEGTKSKKRKGWKAAKKGRGWPRKKTHRATPLKGTALYRLVVSVCKHSLNEFLQLGTQFVLGEISLPRFTSLLSALCVQQDIHQGFLKISKISSVGLRRFVVIHLPLLLSSLVHGTWRSVIISLRPWTKMVNHLVNTPQNFWPGSKKAYLAKKTRWQPRNRNLCLHLSPPL